MTQCDKNSDQKNLLALPNISKPLNDYVCTSRSSLALEPIPEKNPGDFNQGMMELGALICIPMTPKCLECPVQISE